MGFSGKNFQADVPESPKFVSYISRSVENSLQPQLRAARTTRAKKKRGGDGAPADSYRSVLRSQQFQACEIAFAALENRDEQVLRWFTRDVLHVAVELTPMVCLALWEKNKAGEHYWRTAQYPLAYLRTLALRTAAKWKRDPIMEGSVRGKVASFKQGVSSNVYTRRFDPSRLKSGYDFEGEDWHDAALEYFASKDGVDDSERFSDVLKTVDEKFLSPEGSALQDWLPRDKRGPEYNWAVIGKELGFDDDEIELLRTRAKGITREQMASRLLWTENKVEAVWRRVNRKLGKPELAEKARQKLITHQSFVPASLEEAFGESNS